MKLDFEIPKKINDFFEKCLEKFSFFSLWGGRGSTKSHSVGRLLLAISFQYPGQIVLCCREKQNSITDSVYSLLVMLINKYNLGAFFKYSEKSGIQHINGFKFIFKGLKTETVDSIKSIEGAMFCWVEEAHTISQKSLDVLIPTITRNEGFKIFFTLNPRFPTDPVYVEYIERQPEGSCNLKINYTDIDKKFITEQFVKIAESMRETDYDKYNHVYGGEFEKYSDALVFKDKFIVKEFKSPKAYFLYGADFGYSPDPLTCVRCFIKDRYLFIERELYETKVEVEEMDSFFSKMPDIKRNIVVADSSRPELISHMNGKGYKFMKAKKGADSIFHGISFMRSFKKIIIHPRCKYAIEEFSKYSFQIDKFTEKPIPGKLVDKDNHIIDSIRYSVEPMMRKTRHKNLSIEDLLQ